MKNQTFAVVDLETSGPHPKSGRIIQIAIVLVKNGVILSTFASDVNPETHVPKNILQLTGIKSEDLKKAPYFEEIAPIIQDLLKDTVFVAHNIAFDYRFLSAQLTRFGFKPLNQLGIDTVELAQIFMPTLTSYRLQDLSKALGINHEKIHQADSDAESTAQSFLKILEKIEQIPTLTLEKIAEHADALSKDTGAFLKELAASRNDMRDEFATLELVDGLYLRKKDATRSIENKVNKTHYPQSKKAKIALYQDCFEFRKAQARFANLVYNYFKEDST